MLKSFKTEINPTDKQKVMINKTIGTCRFVYNFYIAHNIEIYSLELININEANKQIEFRVSCSKGTYIRTLCEEVAEKLGTVGYMKELKRTKVGEFKIEDAITI